VKRALSRVATCLALFACLLMAAPAVAADDESAAERRIKAAYLVKFVEYVEWPSTTFAQADAPLAIGVVGDDAMLHELESVVTGRRFGDHPLEVRAVSGDEAAAHVQVLFVARGSRLVGKPAQSTLVVTDMPAGIPQGATINFLVKDKRVQFEASLEDAERRHLKLGSGLLSVARNLRRGPA
jgi:hypothetical protein